MKTLGDNLRYAREMKNLTQKEVSKRTGIHNKTISNYENDVSSPDPYTLRTFAEIYETSVDYLLGRPEGGSNTGDTAMCLIDVSDLPEDAVKKVKEYVELLKLKYKKRE